MNKTDSKLDETRPVWLTTEEVAARLGKKRKDITKLVMRGQLHPLKKGVVNVFAAPEVEALSRPGRRPSPWLAGTHNRSTRTRSGETKRSEGAEAALVFRLLNEQKTLREIVVRARVPPHRVRVLYREWQRSFEHGAPIDSHALGDGSQLDDLATAAARLFESED
jgi:hypothetical protein